MRSFLFVLFVALSACTTRPNVADVVLESVSGDSIQMRNVEQEFASEDLKFFGIFAKEWFSQEEVQNFALKYDLTFEMLFDDGNKLAHVLAATVTPEVFVLNSKSEVIYSGKIDNWVNDLGKKKLAVSDHYLQNALLAWRDGKAIETNHTKPVGCLIE